MRRHRLRAVCRSLVGMAVNRPFNHAVTVFLTVGASAMVGAACGTSDDAAPAPAPPTSEVDSGDPCHAMSPNVACQNLDCRVKIVYGCEVSPIGVRCGFREPYHSCATDAECASNEACTHIDFCNCLSGCTVSPSLTADLCWPRQAGGGDGQPARQPVAVADRSTAGRERVRAALHRASARRT
jgi:hypothetical protein